MLLVVQSPAHTGDKGDSCQNREKVHCRLLSPVCQKLTVAGSFDFADCVAVWYGIVEFNVPHDTL